tara:strand:+ start:1871 stop:2830 length:960 start_codon:yes stop_codon:yes gene_type:complete
MIDAVIPAHEKDVDTVGLCAEYIKKNVVGIRDVYVVSRNKLTDNAKWVSEDIFPFTLEETSKIIGKHKRTCWYYAGLIQQTAALVVPDLAEHVLVCDSDTIFARPTKFIDDNGKVLFNVSYDVPAHVYDHPYFEYVEKLIPGLSKQSQYSGIVHHMPVKKSILQSLHNKVEELHGMPFWKASLSVTLQDYKTVNKNCHATGQGMMSTYDLYFNYVSKYFPDSMVVDPKKSVLAYKEKFGVPGFLEHNVPSRTNLYGNVKVFPDDEQNKFKFDNIGDSMRHIVNRAGELGWYAITFQDHTRVGAPESARINDEYVQKYVL